MNSSAIPQNQANVFECELYNRVEGKIDHNTREAYVVLVLIVIINIITFPFTVVLNVLVIVAVKINPRLKT